MKTIDFVYELGWDWNKLVEKNYDALKQMFVYCIRGHKEYSDDDFHDALLSIRSRKITSKFKNQSSFKTFLYPVLKFIVLNQLRKEFTDKHTSVNRYTEEFNGDLHGRSYEIEESLIASVTMNEILNNVKDKKRRRILSLWFKNYTLDEIKSKTKSSNIYRKVNLELIKQRKELNLCQ